jgi:hypothetical protein
METTVKFYSLEYKSIKTYIVASFFILGNIFFPQLCHLVNLGPVLLPIYFFTLIGAYKYGWKVGLLTAILSPLINSMLFGMPAPAALPVILSKSIILAITAGFAAQYFKRLSILLLFGVVLFSQIAGTLVEWAIINNFQSAIQDFRIGIYGMLLQIFGGFFIIKYIIKR